MTDSQPPGERPVVASLLDRLPPRQRARRLASLALGDHIKDEDGLAHYASMAERLEAMDPDARLAQLDELPADLPEVRAGRVNLRAMRAARSFLRNEQDAAFAEWAAVVEEFPEQCGPALILRSMFLMVRGELDAALADLDRAIALAPTEALGYVRRGDVYLRMDRDAEAAANYLRAAQLEPENVRALFGAGVSFAAQEEWAQATTWYGRAIKFAPKRADFRVERAMCLQRLGRVDEALADFEAALALEPESAEIHLDKGRCLLRSARPEAALAALSRAIELDPSCAQAWSTRARAHLVTGSFDAALADAERAMELDPTSAPTRFTQAIIHRTRGDTARALEAYDDTTRLAPTDQTALMARLSAHADAGDMPGFRRAVDAFVAIVPTSPTLRALRGEALLDDRKFDAALEELDLAVDFAARFQDGGPVPIDRLAKVHHQRADALRAKGRHEEAARAEERAVELAPENAQYRSWLGFTRANVPGEEELAEADLNRALELAPADPGILFQRGLYYAGRERWAEALADLDRLIADQPPTGVLHLQRGIARWRATDDPAEVEGAIADYDRAIELDGASAEILIWRSVARDFLGPAEAALADADQAVALDPESGEAYHWRAQLRKDGGDLAGARQDLERAAELGWDDAVEELAALAETPQ